MMTRRFDTPLCKLLGIELPILQSGMRRIASPGLVAEVSRAGGLGILAGLMVPPETLRAEIQRVRQLCDRPFGVNLWLHEELRPPELPANLSEDRVSRVQATLDRFRAELGMAPADSLPPPVPDLIDAQIEVIIEERVAVFSVGLGNPGTQLTARCRDRGVRVIAMASTLGDARALADAKVDAIVAQGSEAGGHRSTWVKPASAQHANVGLFALLPRIVDACGLPVIASGGIADGRGLVAALALGAQAILLGTRFVATREALAPDFFKQAIVKSEADATRITDAFTGLFARVIVNHFVEEYEASGAPVLPSLLQANAAQDIYAAAVMREKLDYFPLMAGQSCGLIDDLPSAADVVQSIIAEALRVEI